MSFVELQRWCVRWSFDPRVCAVALTLLDLYRSETHAETGEETKDLRSTQARVACR